VIILDTNVVSALMRTEPEARVVAWLDGQPGDSVWVTSITVFEARFGIPLLARGRRRRTLESAFGRLLEEDLESRVLNFDSAAAAAAGELAASRQRAGRPMDVRDTFIAGIALSRKASLATRNVRHFQGAGIALANPWS
jgi:predicted nucleic acid-binding protein